MKVDPNSFAAKTQAQMAALGANFSTSAELIKLADTLKPALRYTAKTRPAWSAWRRKFVARLTASLGPQPASVPLRPRVIERVDCGDHIRERVVYRTTAHMSVPAYVLIPKGLPRGARVPAVLTIHGHGYGAVDLVGLGPEERTGGNAHRNYALEVVRRGMVALAPDLRGFGQRAVDEDQLGVILRQRGDPEVAFFKRDMCNVQFLKANLLGYTMMGLQLHDLRCGLDYLTTRKEVNAERLGACGLSTGGMMTLFLTALDARVQAAAISGTLTSYKSYAMRIETTCGTQLPPGIMQYGDLADVGCLIAPRPVCFENGSEDFGFLQAVAKREFVRIRQCYRTLGVPQRAHFDAFQGGHVWHGQVGLPMLHDWLTRAEA
jgi:dienelactone hydrolase